jgi:signal transduction histidine kinase
VQADYAALEPLLPASRHEAWAAVPLIVDRRVIGVLGLSFDAPQAFDNERRGFLLALGEVASQSVDRAAMYESERRARAEAEAAVRTQDEFLSIASHELRTPVAAVKATAQLAQRAIQRGTYDTDRATRHLTSIARAADRLGDLIEDLLDVSRLRTGHLQLRMQTLDLTLLVRDVVERYRTTEVGHRFSLSVPDAQVAVCADALRMEQVLDNFLSNAVKYSPNGGDIDVRVCVEPDGVLLSVQDYGIGLPSGQEARIFEVFGRASNAAAQQIQGLGLGLAICRQLIEAHGGRIWARSPGEHLGTTVGVWLPTTHDAQATPTGD